MKRHFNSLIKGVVALMCLSACSEDIDNVLPSSGEGINFSLSSNQSRTIYDDENEYQINWVDGDKVRIYCDEAEDLKEADYAVKKSSDPTKENEGTLSSVANGLKWGSDNGEHNFIAVYPADNAKIIGKSGDIITLNLNKNQICNFTQDGNGNYIGTPDMNNAYMIAKLSTKPVANVGLSFKPLMTALQITVRGRSGENAQPIALTGISIINTNVKDKAAYQGNFKYDLKNEALIEDSQTPFTQTIFVGIQDGDRKYIDLAGGKSATFTVFVPPIFINASTKLMVRPNVAGDSELDIEIGGVDGNNKPVQIPGGSKAKLTLPYWPEDQVDGNNWITPLDDNIYVQQLSIPGTHDSGAYSTNILDAGRTQALTIEGQWNIGIRAFDIRTAYSWWGRQFWIYHGLTKTDISLNDVISTLVEQLNAHPGEFAIVQLRHETGSLDVDANKWNDIYDILFSQLANIGKLIKWRPDLTIGDCRGKIVLLTRDDYNNRSYAGLISGWPENTYGIAKISNNGVETSYLVQDFYKYNDDETEGAQKKAEFEKLLTLTNQFNNSNSEYFINKSWALNHTSGYAGLIGGTNAYMRNAQYVVPYVYDLVEKNVGPAGIVFMDYAGQRKSPSWAGITEFTMYGDLLPQSIINCNYRYYMLRKMAN